MRGYNAVCRRYLRCYHATISDDTVCKALALKLSHRFVRFKSRYLGNRAVYRLLLIGGVFRLNPHIWQNISQNRSDRRRAHASSAYVYARFIAGTIKQYQHCDLRVIHRCNTYERNYILLFTCCCLNRCVGGGSCFAADAVAGDIGVFTRALNLITNDLF